MKKALVSGGAGFVGSHPVDLLLAEGWDVTVLDNFDPFYDPICKRSNLAAHHANPCLHVVELDLCDAVSIRRQQPRLYVYR